MAPRILLLLIVLPACEAPLPGRYVEERHDSVIVGETYSTWIWLPPGYDGETPHDVLVLLDGGGLIDHMARELLALRPIPGVVLIAPLATSDGFRALNYYPPRLDGSAPDCLGEAPCGEANLFFAFLRDELFPDLEARYALRAAPEARAIWGHSGGGAGVVYALLGHNDTFRGFIAGSPWLLHDGLLLFDYAQALHDRGEALQGKLLLGHGGDETWYAQYVPAFDALLKAHAHPGLDVRYREYIGADHNGAYAPTIRDGLDLLYGAAP